MSFDGTKEKKVKKKSHGIQRETVYFWVPENYRMLNYKAVRTFDFLVAVRTFDFLVAEIIYSITTHVALAIS